MLSAKSEFTPMIVTSRSLSRMPMNRVPSWQLTRLMSQLLRTVTCLALALLAGAAVYGETKPAPEVKAQAPQFFAAGLIDAAGQVGYVDAGEHKIVAIELTSGRELWESKAAMWPLIGVGNELLVLVRSEKDLVVQWREPATGKSLRESGPIVLPHWCKGPIRLSPRCKVIDGQLLLEWLVGEDIDGGRRPMDGAGRAIVELDSGRVSTPPLNAKQFDNLPTEEHKSLGALTFSVITKTEVPSPQFIHYKRTLRAVDATGKQVWERALPTFIVGPPKP